MRPLQGWRILQKQEVVQRIRPDPGCRQRAWCQEGKDRDPEKPFLAIQWFNKFIEQFPDSTKRVAEAREKIVECRNILAEREIYIGNFYKKKKNYKAALERYKNVIEKYPETDFNEKALKLIEETKSKSKEKGSS